MGTITRFLTPSPKNQQFRRPKESISSTAATNTTTGCEGFDTFMGKNWVYPNNMGIRGYQKQAVATALFNNAMIVLPTGFGKTFIAAVVMYNFYRWYPQGKIIFVAPTRPLVAQQIEECKKISGIPYSDCVELTGSTHQDKRHALWHSKRVFFATPQVIHNDILNNLVSPETIKCIVIDEAHKAQGGYAYVEIVKLLQLGNPDGFRVLALSATPGSNIERVKQVMINLFINEVMFRQENSVDLMQFKNNKNVKAWVVELVGKHRDIANKFIEMTNPIFKELHKAGLTFSCDTIERASLFVCMQAQQRLARNEVANVGSRKGKLMFYCSAAMSLIHAFELLMVYGLRPFYATIKNGFEEKKCIKTALFGHPHLDIIMQDMETMFGDDMEIKPEKTPTVDLLKGHPKLKVVRDLLLEHFEKKKGVAETRAMVFVKYRDSVMDVVQTLRVYEPILKVCPFVGQAKGMTQKEQLATLTQFKQGIFNVLVATCVAEEGLDIGEVDLIICYDTSVSPISNTQRRGRTGRKRAGDVQTLVTKGYEERRLNKASTSRRTVEDQLYNRDTYMGSRYHQAPRMVPSGINPECLEQKIFPVNDVVLEEKLEKTPKRKKKATLIEEDEEDDDIKKKKKEQKQDKQDEDCDGLSTKIISESCDNTIDYSPPRTEDKEDKTLNDDGCDDDDLEWDDSWL